jgi:L-alanine-DL-glutamate epimerase-like enolase superfamily enzyme
MELMRIADAHIPSADGVFGAGGASRAIARMLRTKPKKELLAWLIVGKNDDLERDVRPWAVDRGYRCFKLKIMGRDAATDAARTTEVYRRAVQWGVRSPRLTVDSNEANPDARSVEEYLERLRRDDPAAFTALEYLEQPTGRDILKHPFDWHSVSKLKPVLIDEGLTDLATLHEAHKQGWSGVALKTCKGHSFALVAAAWAHEHGMPLALQDLTNPGCAMIQAAVFAAYVPTVNDVELNSPQFTPAANQSWLPRLTAFFEPMDGVHRLPDAVPVGLGSNM